MGGVQARRSPGETRGKPSVVVERSRSAFCGRPSHLCLVFDDTLGDARRLVTENTERHELVYSRKAVFAEASCTTSVHKGAVNIEIYTRCVKRCSMSFKFFVIEV